MAIIGAHVAAAAHARVMHGEAELGAARADPGAREDTRVR